MPNPDGSQTDEERRLEKLYTQVMERHGTDAYTAEDDKFAKEYLANKKKREGGEDVSLGDSSVTSTDRTQKSGSAPVKSVPSTVPTTGQSSKSDQTDSSSASSTAGKKDSK